MSQTWPSRLLCIYAVISGVGLLTAEIAYADCNCGPTYCTDTPEYRKALAQKKASAKANGYPDRLIALYDTMDHCEACIRTSPDAFRILRKTTHGDLLDDDWSVENESNDAKLVKNGELIACYVFLSRRAFSCCESPTYDKRSDYDRELDLNKNGAVVCSE
jgi:hypothetical protein